MVRCWILIASKAEVHGVLLLAATLKKDGFRFTFRLTLLLVPFHHFGSHPGGHFAREFPLLPFPSPRKFELARSTGPCRLWGAYEGERKRLIASPAVGYFATGHTALEKLKDPCWRRRKSLEARTNICQRLRVETGRTPAEKEARAQVIADDRYLRSFARRREQVAAALAQMENGMSMTPLTALATGRSHWPRPALGC